MKISDLSRITLSLCTSAVLAGCGFSGGAGLPGPPSAADVAPMGQGDAYTTTVAYVEMFYPLWFTYELWSISSSRLIGPARMGPLYHAVVAPNDDTLYASTFPDLTEQPMVVTIPGTSDLFSVLSTDAFGDINDTGIKSAGAYALIGPNSSASLPSGVTPVELPVNFSALIVRADKYTSDGTNEEKEAQRFRLGLSIKTLTQYEKNPKGGHTRLLPLAFFSKPYKTIADTLATTDSIKFLTQLQTAVAAPYHPTLTKAQKVLSDHFNALFNVTNRNDEPFIAGTQAAHQMILNIYLQHTGRTNWITFSNISDGWTPLERSAITEFIQYANGHETAAYFQTFKDRVGNELDGSKHSYVIAFSKREIPEAERFWSVTAYLPDSITLVPNALHKYVVASYTPKLVVGKAGSISIYLAVRRPKGIPQPNWLPIPSGVFNVMLRVYGPEGRVREGTYTPPAVRIF